MVTARLRFIAYCVVIGCRTHKFLKCDQLHTHTHTCENGTEQAELFFISKLQPPALCISPRSGVDCGHIMMSIIKPLGLHESLGL